MQHKAVLLLVFLSAAIGNAQKNFTGSCMKSSADCFVNPVTPFFKLFLKMHLHLTPEDCTKPPQQLLQSLEISLQTPIAEGVHRRSSSPTISLFPW